MCVLYIDWWNKQLEFNETFVDIANEAVELSCEWGWGNFESVDKSVSSHLLYLPIYKLKSGFPFPFFYGKPNNNLC
jgi:hypothetical protein